MSSSRSGKYLTFNGDDATNFHRNATNSENEDISYGDYHEEVKKQSFFSFQFLFSKILYIVTGIVILITLAIIVGILIFMSARPSKDEKPTFTFDDMFNSDFNVRSFNIEWTSVNNDDFFINYFQEKEQSMFAKSTTVMSDPSSKMGGIPMKVNTPNDVSCSLRVFSKNDNVGQLLISAEDLLTKQIACGTDFQFDPELKFIAFKTAPEHVFRHSTKGYYVIWDVNGNKWISISEIQKQLTLHICSATRSYWIGEDNNLYMFNPTQNKHIQITKDGTKELIFNGISDWIYEEDVWESDVLFTVSPQCDRIAFLHLDDNEVEDYNFETYDPASPYPKHSFTKYPTAGRTIPKVEVHVATCNDTNCNLSFKTELKDGPEGLGWVFQLTWTSEDQLLYSTTNRIQTELFTYVWNAISNTSRILSHDRAEDQGLSWIQYSKNIYPVDEFSYVQISPFEDYYHLRSCIFSEERNCTYAQITSGPFNVIDVIAVRGKSVFYTATARSGNPKLASTTQYIYRFDLDVNKETILPGQGESTSFYSATISLSGNAYILHYEGPGIPHCDMVVMNENSATITEKESNKLLKIRFNSNTYDYPTTEIVSRRLNGTDLDLLLVRPPSFHSNVKHPVLLYFYGGPGSKQVTQQFAAQRNPFTMYMAAQGFVVATLDNRGTGRKTTQFLQCTYQYLGILEALDQIALKESLSQESWVDESNIMLWGWSFGGFLTLKTSIDPVFAHKTPFRAAAAVAPVTDWAYYNAAYTERFMRTPQLNPEGYKATSVVQNIVATTLKGTNLLLQHGSADDNVHPLNSLNLITKLHDKEIPFNFMFYPNKDHSISGDHTRRFLYRKIGKHFVDSVITN